MDGGAASGSADRSDDTFASRIGLLPGWFLRQPSLIQILALVALATLAWLPFLGETVSPDEGGLLIIGGQWSPGSSLYGDYWVDRPPLLIAFFAIADAAGGATALRLFGLVAVAVSIAAAFALTRLLAPGTDAAAYVAAAVAVALSSPLMGAGVVNGELVAVPFVLVGLVCTVRSLDTAAGGGRASGWLYGGLAGACGAGAALVKQNFLDVFVFIGTLLVLELARRRSAPRPVLRLVVAAGVGALAAGAAMLAISAARGVDLVELWRAVVVFRPEASAIIRESASVDTRIRLARLLGAFALTCLPFLVWALLRRWRTSNGADGGDGQTRLRGGAVLDLRLPVLAVLAWEGFGVLAGGSYWLHYLIGLVPGLALVAALSFGFGAGGRLERRIATVCVLSTVTAVAVTALVGSPRAAQPPIDYLRAQAGAGDTAVVAFGSANILEEADLTSPYPHLWSLPARVLDPDADELGGLLDGADRPDWLVVTGSSIATWGVDTAHVEEVVSAHYAVSARFEDYTVYRLVE